MLVGGEDNYNKLKTYLIEKENFSKDKISPHRLLFSNNIIIDLLPFGGIESNERTVTLAGKDVITLSMFGLKEIHKSAVEVTIDDDLHIAVTTFPGICILKLISYSGRPEARAKDISDINFIIEKYADMNVEYISNQHYDIMGNAWNEILSARVLGRDMRDIMKDDESLRNKIIEILSVNINENYDSKIAQLMTSGKDKTLEQKIEVLRNLRNGILDP